MPSDYYGPGESWAITQNEHIDSLPKTELLKNGDFDVRILKDGVIPRVHQTLVVVYVCGSPGDTHKERASRLVGGFNNQTNIKADIVSVADGQVAEGLVWFGTKPGGVDPEELAIMNGYTQVVPVIPTRGRKKPYPRDNMTHFAANPHYNEYGEPKPPKTPEVVSYVAPNLSKEELEAMEKSLATLSNWNPGLKEVASTHIKKIFADLQEKKVSIFDKPPAVPIPKTDDELSKIFDQLGELDKYAEHPNPPIVGIFTASNTQPEETLADWNPDLWGDNWDAGDIPPWDGSSYPGPTPPTLTDTQWFKGEDPFAVDEDGEPI